MKKTSTSESQSKTEIALQESERKFRETIKYLDLGYYSVTTDGYLIDHNQAYNSIIGIDMNQDLKGQKTPNFWQDPEDRRIYLNELMAKGFIRNYIVNAKKINGEKIIVLMNSHLVKDENDKLLRIEGTVTDFTERKIEEQLLKESEIKYRILVENSLVGVFRTKVNGDVDYVNNSILRMLEFDKSEELQNIGAWMRYKEPKQREELLKTLKDNGKVEGFEANVITKKGNERVFLMNIVINGEILDGTLIDITDRKQAEKIIRDNEKRFRELIESLPQLFWTCRVDGPCDYLSKQWVEYTGVPEADQLGYHWLEQLHHDDKDRTVSEWMEKVKTGESFDVEFRIRRNDGVYHWFKTRAVPMFDADGNIVKWFGSNTDFDEIKKAEEQLINFSKELEQKVEERTKELEAFSYSVSHDLRAPLRHVSGYVELLNKHFNKELSEKGQHYLISISDSVHLMGKLIDDLLRFSRTGRVEMVRSEIDMNGIIQEVKDTICKDNPGRKIEWVIGKLPSVYGDSSMLHLVWLNLLNNAVKFTGTRTNASIEIGVVEGKKEWIFFVKDNGVGFDMAYAHKLFGVFQRLHPMEDYEGTGIGLANVRRIVSRHGGRTWAEAEPDKGAVFYFSIPKNKEEI